MVVGSASISAAFLVIGFFVLSRYRKISKTTIESDNLAKNIWDALEIRLKKQDERIIDVMAKVDVFAVRSLQIPSDIKVPMAAPLETSGQIPRGTQKEVPVRAFKLSSIDTELEILNILNAGPKTTTEVRSLIQKSREHTARLMKILFDGGYVLRNDSSKPFVYQVTESGKRYLDGRRSVGK